MRASPSQNLVWACCDTDVASTALSLRFPARRMGPVVRRSKCSVLFTWLLLVAALVELSASEPASTAAPSSTQSPTSSPQPKEKRSQEDIMFGNQQNKPASGMVDDFFQTSKPASKNATVKASTDNKGSEGSASNGGDRTEHRQTLSEMPDRLDYYDYMQPESSDGQSSGPSPAAVAAPEEEDLEEEEEPERSPFFAPQEPLAFGSQKLLAASEKIDRNELGDYPSPEEEEYEGSGSSRRKRGVFRRLRSPLEDLLSPSGGPFRRRRASSTPMRLKRDAASNELLNWLALLHRTQAARKGNQDEIAFQEFQGLEAEPLELSSDSGYLYEPLIEEDLEEEEGLPASLLDSLPLPEEGADGDALDWDLPLRAPPRRRSFYPLDYRYVILPGSRKRSSLLSAPGGHFGAMREVNRWPGEPQSGHWGQFPLFQHQSASRLGLPIASRRAPVQESDAERLYALASLLAGPAASSKDLVEPDSDQDRRRRRRSPRNPPLRG